MNVRSRCGRRHRFRCLEQKMIAVLLLVTTKLPGALSADWMVTFVTADYCAVKGTSVEFNCSFSYPAGKVVKKTAWYKGLLDEGEWKRVALSVLPPYHKRTEYLGDLLHSCGLAIHSLKYEDTGHYYFRFDTDMFGWRSKGSVHLSVTGLKAVVSPQRVTAGHNVTLDCQTSCPLSNTIWFKDGHRVTKPAVFQVQAEDAGKYVCAAEGQESVRSEPATLDVHYSPFNVRVEVSPPGVLQLGAGVNLTCSSVAHPAADHHAWFRVASDASSRLQVGSDRVLLLPSMEASHAGPYLCQAGNALGENDSPPVLLTVQETDSNHRIIILIGCGVKVVMVVLITLVIILVWKRRRDRAEDKEGEYHDYQNARPIRISTRRRWQHADEEHSHDYENERPVNG